MNLDTPRLHTTEKFYLVVVVLILVILSFSSSNNQQSSQNLTSTIADENTLTIASFNLQIFGESKVSNKDTLSILSKIACEFDIVAVQEIRDKSEESLPQYINSINKICPLKSYVMGPRIGRTSSKENYAFIYDKGKVTFLDSYTYNDSFDKFEREPLISRFRATNLTVIIVNNHIKPDDAKKEIDSLQSVITDVRKHYNYNNNILLVGDFNADCDYFKEDDSTYIKNSEFVWLIPNSADTTTKDTDCTYDRIISTNTLARYYTGYSGVFKFDVEYNLTQEQTFVISDHYPVWAKFNI